MTQINQSIFECDICRDTEWTVENETNTAKPCICREGKRYKRILENSGISEAFKSKTVNEYKPKNKQQAGAKNAAIDYITGFQEIRNTRNNSIAFMGQVGAGKTHLIIAIANALLKKGIGVLYMQYREVLTLLKQCKNDEESYQWEVNRYKNAPVLLVDDLFKGATRKGEPNESEIDIMFEIINHRYLKQLPILVSSEYSIDKMIDFDEATGSRIAHMCKGRAIEFSGFELNHRMV